jgi:hypothetical protein
MNANMTGTKRLAVAMIGIALIGCDDRKNLVPLEQPAQNAASATQPGAAPTTQELVGGPYERVALKAIPFSVSVPRGWELKSQGGMVLQGPTPSGFAQLQIARHLAPIEKHAETLIAATKREAASNPGPYTLAEVRDINGMRALEARSAGQTQQRPAIDAKGKTIAPTTTPLQWKTSVFMPEGRDTVVCEIQFIDLSREQYDLDKDVLTKIMSSLEYDAKARSN